ncbi:MAG: hypothetical protein PHO66_05895 [Eubacteriales bacterium]|nr:hypothetical protein [Eubacteriales bacterium]
MPKNEPRVIDFRYAPEVQQTCIGLADDFYKTIVREDGSLNYGWESQNVEALDGGRGVAKTRYLPREALNLGFRNRFVPAILHRDTLLSHRQEFGDAREAVVTTIQEYEHCHFQWTAVAHQGQDGLRADIVLYRLAAKENFGHAYTNVCLQALGDTHRAAPVAFTPLYRQGRPLDADDNMLHAGEVWEGAFALVHKGQLPGDAFTLDYARRALEETRAYWQALKPFHHTIQIPDTQIQDMVDACARNIMQAREIVQELCEYQVGPTMYRSLWMVDGYFLYEAAYMMGQDDEAFQGLLSVLKRAKPDGAIRIMNDVHDKETGIALAAIVRHCELKNDDERLKECWPALRRGLGFIKKLRARAEAMGEDYPGQKLFPPALGDGGIHGPLPEYTTPSWILFGLRAAYRAGKRLNLAGYEQFGTLFDEVLDSFERCAKRDRRMTDDGLPYFPMCMIENPRYKPQTGTWAFAQAIAAGEVFPPEHPLVQEFLDLLDSVDNTQGLPENTGWRTDQAIWGYSAMFYAQVWLYAGRPDKAVDYLYAFANHAAPSRVWREEQALVGSTSAETCGDMPHNWGSAEFIRLVRHLLVAERGDRLELLSGLPEQWLPTRDRALILEQTPTRFGKISLRMEQTAQDTYTLSVRRRPGNQQPDDMLLHWKGSCSLVPAGEGLWRVPAEGCVVTLKR